MAIARKRGKKDILQVRLIEFHVFFWVWVFLLLLVLKGFFVPTGCRSSWARDGTCVTAVTQATAVTTLDT